MGVGYGLTYAFSVLYPEPGLSQGAILGSFTVVPQRLLIAYVVGFLLTLATVVVASRRSSRLNIVRAIRDLPEPPPTRRLYTYLAYVGALALVLGSLLFLTTYRGTSDFSYPIIGGAMMILGAGLVASRFVSNRVAFSFVGLGFITWAGFEPLHIALLGSTHTGGIFLVFVEGIIMVGGALVLFAFNSAALVAGLLKIAEGSSGRAPVARIALSYPGRKPTRTTITLAIFALVVFTLVAIATTGGSVQASLSDTLETDSGGYTFFGVSTAPIPNLPSLVDGNATLAPQFQYAVPLLQGNVEVNVTGWTAKSYDDTLYSAPGGQNAFSNFYTSNQFPFTSTLDGMSQAAVMQKLETNLTVAIVDRSYGPPTPSLSSSSSSAAHPTVSVGETIRVTNPSTGNGTSVMVIGILAQSVIPGVWINPTTAATLGFTSETAFFLTISSGSSATHAAQGAKAAFFRYGLILFDIPALLALSIDQTEGVISLLQIFVGLGLAVGIAAMGIVAVRAVVERKRDIGMLRANGFTQRMVLEAFFLEYSFVALLGIGIGTALGLLIVYNLTIGPSATSTGVTTFSIPWANILLILVVAYGLAMAAVAEPSLRAARLPPAEAVRPTE